MFTLRRMGLFGDKKKVVEQPDTTGKPGKNKPPPPRDEPPNRGGKVPKEPAAADRGRTLRAPRECKPCRGGGKVESTVKAVDEDGETYDEYVESDCKTCKGEGTI